MCYRNREVKEYLFRRATVERADSEIFVLSLVPGQLRLEVGEEIELVRGVKLFVILAVVGSTLPL